MGIDIGAYKYIELADCVFDEDGEPICPETGEQLDVYKPFVNPDFPGRSDNIQSRKAYKYEEYNHFFRLSYSGYNAWRNQLAQIAGYPLTEYKSEFGTVTEGYDAGAWEAEGGPFWELISFSDCEGVIGPITSAKLAKDFADFQGAADAHEDQRFRDGYNQMRAAFEFAANTGAVDFH